MRSREFEGQGNHSNGKGDEGSRVSNVDVLPDGFK